MRIRRPPGWPGTGISAPERVRDQAGTGSFTAQPLRGPGAAAATTQGLCAVVVASGVPRLIGLTYPLIISGLPGGVADQRDG
jgi:hypothetical protein